MDILLGDKEARVIGCLMEKQLATPEYYPLSLNALVNACNQKTNRDPVVVYDEPTVEAALSGLIQKKLVNRSGVGRVPKYEELFVRGCNLVPREAAVICILLLRGPQTVGEIRGRTLRLSSFEDIEAVTETLNNLESWGMVRRLPRLPGHKESRYIHLLCGPANTSESYEPRAAKLVSSEETSRLEAIEDEIRALRGELESLRNELETFKKQFV